MVGDVDLGNVGQDEGEVDEERRLCVWRGREVVRGGMRECASDSWPALRRRAPNLRVPVLGRLGGNFFALFLSSSSFDEIYCGQNICQFA